MKNFKNYIFLFKQKGFSILFLASFLSSLAQSVATITVVWLIYKETNNPWFISISLICLEVPAMILGPIWGVFLDRFKATRLVIIANLSRALLFVFIMFSSLNNTFELIIFFFLLAFSSSISPIVKSGENKILFNIVPRDNLITANSLMNIQFDLSYIIGPMLGGIIASTSLGIYTFVINVIFLILASILYFFIPNLSFKFSDTPKTGKSLFKNWWVDLSEGIEYLVKNRVIRLLVSLNFFWNFLIWGTIPSLLPILSGNIGGFTSSVAYGIMMASSSVGIVIGSLLVGIKKTKMSPINIVFLSIGLHGVTFGLLGVPLNIYYLMIILMLAGFISAPAMIYNRTVFQLMVPEEKQGRIFTLSATAGALGFPLGNLLVAHLITIYGIEAIGYIFLICGLIMVLVTLYAKFNLKRDRNQRTFDGTNSLT